MPNKSSERHRRLRNNNACRFLFLDFSDVYLMSSDNNGTATKSRDASPKKTEGEEREEHVIRSN